MKVLAWWERGAVIRQGRYRLAVEVLERHLTLYQEHLKKMQAVYPHYFQSKA